ncbi:MAG: isomerase [Gammaproteobacteria bacterium]|nr:isomerase [Gammaproteobacteria bacterium]
MKLDVYYVDAFTDKLFSGNPAAVIFSNIDDSTLMQNIAAENNLSETAFIKQESGKFYIRWFAPSCEIDLCGHATLASAFVFFNFINPSADIFEVNSLKNGTLKVTRKDQLLILDFPKDDYIELDDLSLIENIIDVTPKEIYKGRDDVLAIIESEQSLLNLNVNFELLKKINSRGLIVSAKGDEYDFVSRCFFPSTGVNEDPVTGSAHTTMIPYWSKKLKKNELVAKQLSSRGGVLFCTNSSDRVFIGGYATLYLKGEISL